MLLAVCAVHSCAQYPIPYDSGVVCIPTPACDCTKVETCDAGSAFDPDGSIREPDWGKPCHTVSTTITVNPLDIMMLLDESGSMAYQFKWFAVKDAVQSFVTNRRFSGMGVGIQYFPTRTPPLCRLADYLSPEVPIGTLPDHSATLTTSLNRQVINSLNSTPMSPALAGTGEYLRTYVATKPGHQGLVVLMTDGLPDNTCTRGDTTSTPEVYPNTIPNVVRTAERAYTGNPPIKTFVVGVGKNLQDLNEIADAGGTKAAILVDVQADNATRQFVDALESIRRSALGCEFNLPSTRLADGTLIDPNFVWMRLYPEGDDPSLIVQVPTIASCTGDGSPKYGWYFFRPGADSQGSFDAGSSDVIRLCPATCDYITSGITGKIQADFRCGAK